MLPPDPSALLDDWLLVTDTPERLRIEGLDAGLYEVFVYGVSIDLPTTFIVQSSGAFESTTVSGGWGDDFEEGVNYASLTLDVTDGRIDIDWVTGSAGGLGATFGVQIVEVPTPSTLCVLAMPSLGLRRRRR